MKHPHSDMTLYPKQNPETLDPYYSAHVNAMTAEDLHRKSSIAEQLAWRDKELDELRTRLAEVEKDAARYRWLRMTTNKFTNNAGECIEVKLHPEEWDTHIDESMKERP